MIYMCFCLCTSSFMYSVCSHYKGPEQDQLRSPFVPYVRNTAERSIHNFDSQPYIYIYIYIMDIVLYMTHYIYLTYTCVFKCVFSRRNSLLVGNRSKLFGFEVDWRHPCESQWFGGGTLGERFYGGFMVIEWWFYGCFMVISWVFIWFTLWEFNSLLC